MLLHARLRLVLLLLSAVAGVVHNQEDRGGNCNDDGAMAAFLQERAAWSPLCLYTFDDPAIGTASGVAEHVGDSTCPFGALRPERKLVATLNREATFNQLGVRLLEDPSGDSKRVQLGSVDTVSAREFFTMAAVSTSAKGEAAGGGVTFEMVLRRRRMQRNRSMTLFSIANEFDSCVDPGFRLDLNAHQALVFIYFLPVLEDDNGASVEACYEQRLFSVDTSVACLLPSLVEPVEDTPPVHITVTLDPSSESGLWKTDFYMSYMSSETKTRVDCAVHDEQHPPTNQLLTSLVEGRYRLFLGNSPRNVSSPRERKQLAPAREFRALGSNVTALNATEQLRRTIKQKLMSIQGPRLPKAMRIFGDNSFSLSVLGVTFPPLSENTPLAYLRSKLEDFKEQYGDQIVDYLVGLVQGKTNSAAVVQKPSSQRGGLLAQLGQGEENANGDSLRAELFQGAEGSTFDLFHFALYRRVVSEEQVTAISRQWLLPSRRFPGQRQALHVLEDSTTLLDLTMLLSVFDDLRLELRGVPEFGRLLLFPNQTVLTPGNIDTFRDLPLGHQRRIFFQPEADQNNDNLPLPSLVAFSRRMQPYASVVFGVAQSLAGRSVNRSEEAQIDIFVDAVNDAPSPREYDLEICVEKDVFVQMDLEGDDQDGAPSEKAKSEVSDANSFVSSFTYSDPATSASKKSQLVQIVHLPRFGKLFDCNSSCGEVKVMQSSSLESLEPFRVRRNTVENVNTTVSTGLAYVYRGWGQNVFEPGVPVVDELWYRLTDGDPGVFSNVAKIKFIRCDGGARTERSNHSVLAVLKVREDSLRLVELGELEPLVAMFDSKTRYQVTTLPSHGGLYQYKRWDTSTDGAASNESGNRTSTTGNLSVAYVGRRITKALTVVTDPLGFVVYAPNHDYFNIQTDASVERVSAPDFFEYRVINTSRRDNDAEKNLTVTAIAARSDSFSQTRRVLLDVTNEPDALSVLPPVTFRTNLTRGSGVPVPIVFEDPDNTAMDALYHVSFEAADGVSEFELGFTITDDDVMTDCPFDRPCTLLRSMNGSRMNGSSDGGKDHQLQFEIATQLYDGSHVDVTGTRAALSTALEALVFRDLSVSSSKDESTAQFTMRLKRTGDEDGVEVETIFTIAFAAFIQDESTTSDDLLPRMAFHLSQYVWTVLVLAAGWVVLSNALCFSPGFCLCCCCCSTARKKQRALFERTREEFLAQEAQNDHEYSILLLDLVDLLLEPDLLVSVSLLTNCAPEYPHTDTSTTKQAGLMRAFCLRSLLPLLESERLGTRFVFRLVASEYADRSSLARCRGEGVQIHAFLGRSSTASTALACFCRYIGTRWLATVITSEEEDATKRFLGGKVAAREVLLDRLATQIENLPAEIVILCRACTNLFQSRDDSERLAIVHLVFFGHFLGPALLFPHEEVLGFVAPPHQKRALRDVASALARAPRMWNECSVGTEEQVESVGSDFVQDGRTMSSRELRHGDSSESLLGGCGDAEEADLEARCQAKYMNMLITIDRSSSVTSSYVPSEQRVEPDCDLMAMCLMNIHSLLDGHFPEFRRQYEQIRSGGAGPPEEHGQRRMARLTSLLKTLSFPIATIDVLIEHARLELEQDELLWHGFSLQEWEIRARSLDSKPTLRTTLTQRTAATGECPHGAATRSLRALHAGGELEYENQQSPGV